MKVPSYSVCLAVVLQAPIVGYLAGMGDSRTRFFFSHRTSQLEQINEFSSKLVPQDSADEPASQLLERIHLEKARLVKEGKLKKQEPLPPIKPEEMPFELPEGWEWVQLQSVCTQITDGTHFTPTYLSDGMPFISVKDVSKGHIDFTSVKFISRDEHDKLVSRCRPELNDLLLTKVGTTGIAVVVDTEREFSL